MLITDASLYANKDKFMLIKSVTKNLTIKDIYRFKRHLITVVKYTFLLNGYKRVNTKR